MRIVSISLALLWLAPSTKSIAAEPFKSSLELQGFSFSVAATHNGSINHLKVTAKGPKKPIGMSEVEIDGTVSGADVGDLDRDGFPEVYVFVNSAGSDSYGSVVAYAVNKGKSMTPIYLPPLTDDEKASKGYMGHDEFAIIESSLARRFPIYTEADTNAAPGGKIRQLQYKLFAGEAGWILLLKDIVEY